ncbi:MAG TPA: succinyl-diaminopimelate desuccinylase [Acidimicrobiales bacterium]|nr:succinyl-diaminopimelate desuccinylase [Acidimicrobiales bacterium]
MAADLLEATASLIAVASESGDEAALAGRVEAALRAAPWLEVDRIGDNVVARTREGVGDPAHPRVLLAGHLDTVPANGNGAPRIDGDTLWGLGAADMKGGLAVMLDLATAGPTGVPATWVFYAREEVARSQNGLLEVAAARPDLLAADVAVVGEPSGAVIEAGCQGVLKAVVTVCGRRAHSARPWMGVNAVHRLAPVLAALASADERRPEIDGCRYREALAAVAVGGGVAGNVVPDRAEVTLSHRFAPDRDAAAAEGWLRSLLAPHLDADLGDHLEVVDRAPSAAPGLGHPVLARLLAATGAPPRAKLGWTDVAFFAERGVPAVNFGPGDPELAHRADERVERAELVAVRAALADVLGVTAAAAP